jgi:hypothetical protein
MPRFLVAGLVLIACTVPASAGPTDAPTADELSVIFRGLLTSALPDPLVQHSSNWGNQKKVANGVTWEKGGPLLKPHVQKKLKNDGTWQRLKVEAIDPQKTLTVNVLNLQYPEKGKVTFDVLVTLQTRITFEQEAWLSGIRLYSGEIRARCRPLLLLRCESATSTANSGGHLPDVVFRMRATDGRLSYDQFKVEHIAGVGGDMAKVLGESAHSLLNQLRPSIERNMLEKASQAIVKAADTKDVKLSLGKLAGGK